MRAMRRILTHRRVEPHVSMVLSSRIVDQPVRFFLRERGLQVGAFRYRIRENGMRTVVAHRTGDVHALAQAFHGHSHDPPPGARAALDALGHPLRALDVGANVGIWGLWLFANFDVARVIALEPDPENVLRHQRQIEINDLESRWMVRAEAATTADGPVRFTVGRGTNGAICGNDSGTQVDGVDVFSLLDDVDLLKIDIEGGEWPIVADPRFLTSVPVVMLEYHAHGAPGDPATCARHALERAGYLTELEPEFAPGFGTVWGHLTPSR